MGALFDLVKVLFEPGAVFERVREKPRFLWPYLGLTIVAMVLQAANLPFVQAAMRAQAAQAPAGAPDTSKFAVIGIAFVPLGVIIALLISAALLWILTSLMGGEAKFGTLLSVSAYAAVPSVLLLGIVFTYYLMMSRLGSF